MGHPNVEVPEEVIPFDELSIEEVAVQLKVSAQTVIQTCMDIRRGENVLIVCDPTTGDIGQALHEAANERSDRVLLIVMPKARHHGEEPPSTRGKFDAPTTSGNRPNSLFINTYPCNTSISTWRGSCRYNAWNDQ